MSIFAIRRTVKLESQRLAVIGAGELRQGQLIALDAVRLRRNVSADCRTCALKRLGHVQKGSCVRLRHKVRRPARLLGHFKIPEDGVFTEAGR
jgi:hypothetical protein